MHSDADAVQFDRLRGLVAAELGLGKSTSPLRPDETGVWALARLHQVAPILAPGILRAEPGGVLESEARYYRQVGLTREELYRRAFDEIREALGGAGVHVTPLKGLLLATKIYPIRGVRMFRDLDLWIRGEDLRSADREMKRLGFVPLLAKGPLARPAPVHSDPLEVAEAGVGEAAYVRGPVNVEFHTVLLPSLVGEYPRKGAEREAAGLTAETGLAHLCFHATRHHFPAGLRHLCDIALWVTHRHPDPVAVETRMRETRTFDVAYPAWSLAAEHFPDHVPAPGVPPSRWIRKYRDRVAERFAEMPLQAIGLAGSPLPFLWARGGFLRAVVGTVSQAEAQVGNGTRGRRLWKWRVARPFGLLRRHAPVAWSWIRFAVR